MLLRRRLAATSGAHTRGVLGAIGWNTLGFAVSLALTGASPATAAGVLTLAAADFLLIALQCEYLALEGLGQILRNVDRLKAAHVNDDLQLGGVVMTMFDLRTNLSRQVVDEVKNHLPDKIFASVIPRTIRLSEAPSFGKTIFAYDPSSPGASAYKNLAIEVIERFSLKS
jgi:chromosome partitioning protein